MDNTDSIPGRAICERCRNPRPLHRDGIGRCTAPGCHAGPDGGPCPGFVYGGVIIATGRPWPRAGEQAADVPDALAAIPPEQDRAWREMVALGQEIQGESPPEQDLAWQHPEEYEVWRQRYLSSPSGPPDRGPGYYSDGGVPRILGVIEAVDAWLDEAAPQWAKDCPEASMYRRVGKAQLEAAEAMEELSLLTGENPRKSTVPGARARMLAELGDTAVAALLGIQSQAKNMAETWQIFLAAVDKAASRVPAVHIHDDDGTVEGCPGCFPGPARPFGPGRAGSSTAGESEPGGGIMTTVAESARAELGNAMPHQLQILSAGPDLMVSCSCLRWREGSTWQRKPIEIRRVFPARDAIAAWRAWHRERGVST